jgi:hypothetical protein
MEDSKSYFTLEVVGNKRTKSGDQINEWLSPQVEEMNRKMNEWDWSKPFEFEMPQKSLVSEFDDLLKGDELPENLPEIGKLLLFDSSKFTDFIKGSFLDQYGYIVSAKAKSILSEFNLGRHKFYPLTITLKGFDNNDYFFLKCLTNSIDYIDFKNSNFYSQEGFFNKASEKQQEFNTQEELITFRKNYSAHKLNIFSSKIKLSKDFPDFDFFKIDDFGFNETFLTNKLSKQLVKLSGLTLTRTTKVI